MNVVRNFILENIPKAPVYASVRRFERKKYIRRYGYESPLLERGPLPRLKNDKEKIEVIPDYKPKNPWSNKKALFGQNDYIDILGDGSIHPVKLLTNVPGWLRGFQGNEFQMLLRQRVTHFHWQYSRPAKWNLVNKRIRYLYKWLNRKTEN
ncbi:large ribosomal subunit protein mL51 [Centruroides vittatus]|uniref:large ribosomal subunit protein mL51 n=1 Tax=Centruroides vittatus TaxID=120091 RepID=UPI00350F8B01